MLWVCVVITNTQWLEDYKEQVSGFLSLWRKVSWIILVKFGKYYYRWFSYWCRWDVLILIWVNISEKNPSDESEWSWVRDLNENLKRNLQDWRNPTNTRAEPFWGFRVFRWAISGFPRKCTGGTHLKVPPDPPDTRNEAVHYFEPRDEFQIFRKLLKTKLKYSTN